jgi:valyl-tRNA synthetase
VAPRAGVQGVSISLQPYPDLPDAGYLSDDYLRVEADVEWFKTLVTSLRGVRSGLGVAPGRAVPLLVCEGDERDRALVERYAAQLSFLLRLESIRWLDAADDAPVSATALHGGLKLLVPLEGLMDLGAERARLDKELKRVQAEIAKCGGKLASETFVDNAPPAVVEQERRRLAEWNAQLEGLKAQRAKL